MIMLVNAEYQLGTLPPSACHPNNGGKQDPKRPPEAGLRLVSSNRQAQPSTRLTRKSEKAERAATASAGASDLLPLRYQPPKGTKQTERT